MAIADRNTIMPYIAQDKPTAATDLDIAFETNAERARQRPTLYQIGRVSGTREIVVLPNCAMVYRVVGNVVEVLRVLHAAQQWP